MNRLAYRTQTDAGSHRYRDLTDYLAGVACHHRGTENCAPSLVGVNSRESFGLVVEHRAIDLR
jgi:hypothetical protein